LHIYRKVGCETWEQYCAEYLRAPHSAFDELIEGVRILKGRKHIGPISATQAQEASRAERAQRLAADEKVEAMPAHGEIGRGRDADRGANGTSKGSNQAALVRRIKRDRPDLAERLARGEFTSVRAAAREAGLVREPSPLAMARKLWIRMSDEERSAFLIEIGVTLSPPSQISETSVDVG